MSRPAVRRDVSVLKVDLAIQERDQLEPAKEA